MTPHWAHCPLASSPSETACGLGATGESRAFSRHLGNHPLSDTFHGRDLFAPVAGHLADGTAVEEFGSAVEAMVELELPVPVSSDGAVRGQVLTVARFLYCFLLLARCFLVSLWAPLPFFLPFII